MTFARGHVLTTGEKLTDLECLQTRHSKCTASLFLFPPTKARTGRWAGMSRAAPRLPIQAIQPADSTLYRYMRLSVVQGAEKSLLAGPPGLGLHAKQVAVHAPSRCSRLPDWSIAGKSTISGHFCSQFAGSWRPAGAQPAADQTLRRTAPPVAAPWSALGGSFIGLALRDWCLIAAASKQRQRYHTLKSLRSTTT